MVLLSSCGSGALTHAQLVAQANAICKADKPEQDRLFKDLDPESNDLTKAGQTMDKLGSLARQERQKLEALKPPASDQARMQELLGLYDQLIALFQRMKTSLQAQDAQAMNTLDQQATTLSDRGTQVAGALGLTECQ
jgi:hypothetical protein